MSTAPPTTYTPGTTGPPIATTPVPTTTAAPTTAVPTTSAPTTTLTTFAPLTTAPPTTVAPSTAPPTTLAGTTLAPTTLGPTTVPPTTVPDTDIQLDPIEIVLSYYFVYSYYHPGIGPSPTAIAEYPGTIDITVTLHGSMRDVGILVGAIEIVVTTNFTRFDIGQVIALSAITLYITTHFVEYLIDRASCNWVKWSKVGYLDFTIDESNVAGERPVDWKGCVYHLGVLRDKVVAYGENGVSMLKPSGIHYGMDTIHRIGLKNKGAFTGNKDVHFFVDTLGQLYQIDSKLTKLDYSEFLEPMSDIVMSLDIEKNILYICDDTTGYVYGIESNSFGEGPVNISGLGAQGNVLSVASPAAIETPLFELCTDIHDLGTRKPKTIRSVEVGTNVSEYLQASIDYRTNYRDDFKQIKWHLVNPDGKAYPTCYGVEFRFRLKSLIYEYFEIDWLKVKGNIHGYSYLDTSDRG